MVWLIPVANNTISVASLHHPATEINNWTSRLHVNGTSASVRPVAAISGSHSLCDERQWPRLLISSDDGSITIRPTINDHKNNSGPSDDGSITIGQQPTTTRTTLGLFLWHLRML
jgi:hypothetical protein